MKLSKRQDRRRRESSDSILPHPRRPGMCRICPQCGAWFALRQIDERSDPQQVTITRYQWASYQAVVEFAAEHPPGAV